MRSSQIKWIYAQLYFAWVGFLHFAKKIWPWAKKEPGLELFKQNYFSEGHLPVSLELRAMAHEPGRCTTCGICDTACPEALSPMRMLLTLKNLTPNCLSCKICETACPEQIPIITYVHLASKTFHPGPSWRQISGT
ncbi:MAG: hypothetical protein WCK49_09715 [Myxococcaceae bacterium]